VSQVLVFGRFALRMAERVLLVDGDPVVLGARAFDVLQALAERSRLIDQLASARNAAAKARQMSQRVELNLQIQRLQRQLQELQDRLAT
jgi:DNA-binding winged helix-turn-helix (wHTH) protein